MKASHPEEAPAHGELAALVSGNSIELKALLGRLQGNGVRIFPLSEGQVPDSGVPAPGLLLCDLASPGALAAVSDHLARAGDGSAPHLVTLGTLRASPSESEAILLARARLRYRRPLDVQTIANELLALLREPRPSTRAPQSQREITLPPLKPRASQTPKLSVPPRIEALPATSSSIPSPPAPEEPGVVASRQLPGPGAEHSAVSPELETLLAEAERRVQAQISATGDALASTPPEATSAHLSDDVWDALAEPLEDDGESPAVDLSSDAVMPPSPLALDPVEPSAPPAAESTIPPGRWQDPVNDDTGSFAPLPESEADDSEATSGSINPETAAGRDVGPVTVAPGGRHESTENHIERSLETSSPPSTRPPSTASLQQRRSAAEERPVTSPLVAPGRPALTVSLRASPEVERTPPQSAREVVSQPRPAPVTAPSLPPMPALPAEAEASEDTHGSLPADAARLAPPARGQRAEPSSPGSAPRLELPSALVRGGAPLVIGRAVRQRFTGCLAFEVDQGLRRIVFKDGDVVIAASAVHGESLVAFLAQRGDLSAETAAQIEHRIPPFGRHAGAALIARVLLQQSELWPVLRAHSEWVLAQIALIERGTVQIEHPVPERLAAEPAVFGGATGAEVLVEVIERAIAPARALEHLGSDAGKFAAGPASSLLGECALSPELTALVERARDVPLSQLLEEGAQQPIFPCVLYALCLLEVLRKLEAEPHVAARAPALRAAADAPDELDDEAVRARVLARRALVDDGDYFALLGVPRQATGYDIRRSYTELRRQFEPARVLRQSTLDLADDVETILEVLDEAYEILRDQQRRERYRRAIESRP